MPFFRKHYADQSVTSADVNRCHLIWPALREIIPFDSEQYLQLVATLDDKTEKLRSLVGKKDVDICDVVNVIRTSTGQTRQALVGALKSHLSLGDEVSENEIELLKALEMAASILTMVNIKTGTTQRPSDNFGLEWGPDNSLEYIIKSYYRPNDGRPTVCSTDPIDKKLTMRNLAVKYGFEINWTNNLEEHLFIDWPNRVVSIYQHKLWLFAHLSKEGQCQVPSHIIGECLDTINLLFPHHDHETKSFLKRWGRNFNLLGSCGREVPIYLESYPHWGKNLEELLGVLKGPQIWYYQLLPRADRGNLIDSVNFWIALFVAILAIISFVFGLVAVIYAKLSYQVSIESLKLTREQYFLSLAQACSDPNVTDPVLEFCQG